MTDQAIGRLQTERKNLPLSKRDTTWVETESFPPLKDSLESRNLVVMVNTFSVVYEISRHKPKTSRFRMLQTADATNIPVPKSELWSLLHILEQPVPKLDDVASCKNNDPYHAMKPTTFQPSLSTKQLDDDPI